MKRRLKQLLPTFFVVLMMYEMLVAPAICIEGAKTGLLLWFNKILPTLLPFIILTNVLAQLGAIKRISHIATPFTKLLFNLPGISSFVFLTGLIAGYPTGAKLTKQLLEDGQLTFEEAQRTLCFCNNCGPLFIIGAVGTAMLGDPKIGYFLLFVHFASALLLGILFRCYQQQLPVLKPSFNSSFRKPTSFYAIFNNAVQNAMDTIVYVGAYIIFFSVIITLLKDAPWLHSLLNTLEAITRFPKTAAFSLLMGSLELSNGISFLSTAMAPSLLKLALISTILAFGGFCVYFQSFYVLEDFPLSMSLYLLAKFFQSLLAFFLTYLLSPLFFMYTQKSLQPLLLTNGLILLVLSYFISLFLNILSKKRQKNRYL